jgi:hypothetical protein
VGGALATPPQESAIVPVATLEDCVNKVRQSMF